MYRSGHERPTNDRHALRGAVMDGAVSIASAQYEMKALAPNTKFRALVASGMNAPRLIVLRARRFHLDITLLPMLQNRIHPKPKHVTHPIDDDYYQINNQVAAKDIRIFCNQPVQIFKIIQILQRRNDITSIEPQTLRAWWSATRNIRPDFYNNPDNRRQFISFFKHEEGLTHIMRFLNLYGVLGRYLPAWEKITGLLQHDLFHIYPVDDHILTVLHNIRRFAIEARSHENPFASSLMQSFPQQHILYLAAIFHDIAKGRGGNHSLQGVADARKFAADHFLSQEEQFF